MNEVQFILSKMAEEGGEVSQAAVKASTYTLESHDPRNGEGNIEALVNEYNDLLACAELLKEECPQHAQAFAAIGNPEAVEVRKRKILETFAICVDIGTVVLKSKGAA